MQTFFPYKNPYKSAQVLDRKRLGKQRVEACQIASCLLEKDTKWKNHPAVKMWKGYETYLIRVYIPAMMIEWKGRGYKNEKTQQNWQRLFDLLSKNTEIKVPIWLTNDFCKAHQSNLVRKEPDYYKQFFPNVPNNLPYIWS